MMFSTSQNHQKHELFGDQNLECFLLFPTKIDRKRCLVAEITKRPNVRFWSPLSVLYLERVTETMVLSQT